MKTILVVFGTRPEAIKMAPIIYELKKHPDSFSVTVCVTGQHREMLDQILRVFKITPEFNLEVMADGQDLFDISAKIIQKMKKVLEKTKPDVVLVQGDTTTCLAAALSAFYHKIPVGHIEAGLRTYNRYSPYPEEMNRQLTTKIATFHFAPTENNKRHLREEKIAAENIVVTGNTVIDALHIMNKTIHHDKILAQAITAEIDKNGYTLKKQENKRRIILVTGHRRENFGQGFLNICNALREIALLYPDVDIVYPVHLNPNVQKPVTQFLSGVENIYLLKPLTYEAFVYLMGHAYLILTDSGGIQEEAPSLGKPTLVMRENTERPESVEAGTVKLVGTDAESITRETQTLLTNRDEYLKMAAAKNPYGDGTAAEKTVSYLKRL